MSYRTFLGYLDAESVEDPRTREKDRRRCRYYRDSTVLLVEWCKLGRKFWRSILDEESKRLAVGINQNTLQRPAVPVHTDILLIQ